MAIELPNECGDAPDGLPPLAGLGCTELEAIYLEWLRSYADRLSAGRPDGPSQDFLQAAHVWARRFHDPGLEEAVRTAAMWWDGRRTLP